MISKRIIEMRNSKIPSLAVITWLVIGVAVIWFWAAIVRAVLEYVL